MNFILQQNNEPIWHNKYIIIENFKKKVVKMATAGDPSHIPSLKCKQTISNM